MADHELRSWKGNCLTVYYNIAWNYWFSLKDHFQGLGFKPVKGKTELIDKVWETKNRWNKWSVQILKVTHQCKPITVGCCRYPHYKEMASWITSPSLWRTQWIPWGSSLSLCTLVTVFKTPKTYGSPQQLMNQQLYINSQHVSMMPCFHYCRD